VNKIRKLRPPGALEEKKFTKKCTKCSLCIKNCPLHALKYDENRFPKFIGPCVKCMKCVDVCPTGALQKISQEKVNIGYAKINNENCRSWNPKVGDCLVCWEWCPQGAVKLISKDVKNNPKKDPRSFVANPVIDKNICIGCAICVHACPEKTIKLFKR